MESGERLLTSGEAASFLRCARPTLWRWRKSGKIKAVKAAGKLLFPKSTLEQFVKEHTEA